MENFYLTEISLQNFRQFENEKVLLNPHLNWIIGNTASGKTTILEAVCITLGAYLATFKTYVPSRFVYNISASDVRLKSQMAEEKNILISSGIEQYPCKVNAELLMDNKKFRYKRIMDKKGGRTKFDGDNPMQQTIAAWETSMKQGNGSDRAFVFPLVLYLSSDRLWNENKGSGFNSDIPNRTDAYHRCLDKKRGMHMPFRYIQYLKEISIQENKGVDFPAYTLIMYAINECMREVLKAGQMIEYSLRHRTLILVEADESRIPFDELSNDCKDVVKIVADIAIRMCILNPYLKTETFKKTPGVVVIDDLDLSLHPDCQKRVIRILTGLFPKVQFICSSHSSFLIRDLEEGHLIAMED